MIFYHYLWYRIIKITEGFNKKTKLKLINFIWEFLSDQVPKVIKIKMNSLILSELQTNQHHNNGKAIRRLYAQFW